MLLILVSNIDTIKDHLKSKKHTFNKETKQRKEGESSAGRMTEELTLPKKIQKDYLCFIITEISKNVTFLWCNRVFCPYFITEMDIT